MNYKKKYLKYKKKYLNELQKLISGIKGGGSPQDNPNNSQMKLNKNEYINTKCSINKIAKEYKWRPIINIKTSINSYKNRLII